MAPLSSSELALLYQTYIGMVRQCARRIVREPAAAEDVAQDAFVKFLGASRRAREVDHPAALLYRIATNEAVSWVRKSSRRSQLRAEKCAPARSTHSFRPYKVAAGIQFRHEDVVVTV